MPAPRQSAEIKSISGSREPQLPVVPLLEAPALTETPRAPTWLPNGHATREWKRLAPILVQNGRLSDANLSAFGLLCTVWGQIVSRPNDVNASLAVQYMKLCELFGILGTNAALPSTSPKNRFAAHGKRP